MKNKDFSQAPMKKLVAISTIAQVISQVVSSILGVVMLKVLTVSLGLHDYGLFATILALVTTFSLLTDLGLNAITAREIAKNPEEADDIISHNMGLRIFLSLLMIPVIFGVSYTLYPHAPGELHFGTLLFSTYLLFDSVRSVALAYFTSKVRNDIVAIVNGLQQFVLVGAIIVAAVVHWKLLGFVLTYVVANAIGMILSLYLARKEVNIWPRINFKKWKVILGLSLSLGIIQVINMMYLKADSLILSVLKGTTVVGIYGVAYSIILAMLSLPSFIMSALIPSMATSTSASIKPIVQKAYDYMAIFACLLAAAGFIVRHDIVLVVASKSFHQAATPFAILALASAFSYLNNVFGFASVSVNKHHKIVYISATTLLLNVVLNFILIPHFSINGAAWATVVSEFLAFLGVYHIFNKETGAHINVVTPLLRPLISAILLLPILGILHFMWSTGNHLVNLIVSSVLILIAYVFLLGIMRGFPSEISNFLSAYLPRRAKQ